MRVISLSSRLLVVLAVTAIACADDSSDAIQAGRSITPLLVINPCPAVAVPARVPGWLVSVSDPLRAFYGSVFSADYLDLYPTGRDIWSVLEKHDQATVVNRIDVAGIYGGKIGLFGVRGASWTQNHYYLNGLNVTDPYDGGKPLFFPDFDSISELRVVTAGLPARQTGAGGAVEILSEEPGERIHADARFYTQGSATQWDRISPRLLAQGALGAFRFRSDYQAHVDLGGPVRRGPWKYFAALSARDLAVRLPGFPRNEKTEVVSAVARLERDTGRQHVGVFWTGQSIDDNYSGGSFRTPPSSTSVRKDSFGVIQGSWAFTITPKVVLEARGGRAAVDLKNQFQSTADRQQSGLDLFNEFQSGLAPFEVRSARDRWSAAGQVRYLAGVHALQAGGEATRAGTDSRYAAFQDVGLRFLPVDPGTSPLVRGPSLPSSVVQYNTPLAPRQTVSSLAAFLEYDLRVRRRLGLSAGVRLDSVRGGLPAQSSPAGSFAPGREYGAERSLISWTDVEPRLGVVFAPFVRATTVFRAGFVVLHEDLPARYLDWGNPNSLSGNVWSWADSNGDRQYQPGETVQLQRRFGGLFSRIDPGLKRPQIAEIVLSAEQHLPKGFFGRAELFRRREEDRVEVENVGVPFSSYIPVAILDPGGDYRTGTADDYAFTVYNQDPATLGHDEYLLTNPSGLDSVYDGMEYQVGYKAGERAALSLLFTAFETHAYTGRGNSEFENDQGQLGLLLDSPNSLIFARARLYFDRAYTARLLGFWLLPRRWTISTVARYFDGRPFGRKLVVTGLNQGPFYIQATPRGNPVGHRTEFNLTMDLRVRKTLDWKGTRLSLVFDIFNLLNADNKTDEGDLSGPLFSLRVPLQYQPPRIVRLGLELSF